MPKHSFTIIVFFVVSLFTFATPVDSLFARFKTAAGFDYNYPREKVFVHLDNNAYLEGETLWFKAYVVRASTLRPTDLSRVLYAELLNDKGSVVQRKLLRIDSLGQANGEFELNLPVKAGYYEVRAYTREMTNWGEAACFSRVIPVFATNKKRDALGIPWLETVTKTSAGRPRLTDFDERRSVRRLDFFPEGGHRVGGVAQRMAFRLTDGRGVPARDTLRLYDSADNLVTVFESAHEGMGAFELPSSFTAGYVSVGKHTFPVPEPLPAARYALRVDRSGEGLTLLLSGGDAVKSNELLGVAVFCREQAVYFDTLSLGRENVEMLLPHEALRGGVNRIEVFDASGRSVCRRLVWRDAPERELVFEVKQNKASYDAFSPVALELSLKDKAGRPVQTTFSLSVRDDGGELIAAPKHTAAMEMLLSSELKGYIHQPEYYFETTSENRHRDLDLLMMVQGWTANSFETLSGREPFVVEQPIEEQLTLTGRTYRDNNKMQPYAGLSLRISMYSREGASLVGEAVTDNEGRFAFTSNVDFTGDWIPQITTRDSLDKRRWSRIALDRWFSPAPRSFDWRELMAERPTPLAPVTENLPSDGVSLFEWNDTIPRYINSTLGEAVVVHRNKYNGFTGNRYTYNGGEEAGMRNSDVFYNIEEAVERHKDNGGGITTIYRFLEMLDSDFSLRTDNEGRDEIYYRNQRPTLMLNNERNFKLPLEEMMADEFKSVGAMKHGSGSMRMFGVEVAAPELETGEDDTQLNNTQPEPDVAENINPDFAVSFYEDPDHYRFKTKKGVEKRRIQGYTVPSYFYSPSYNGVDLPSDADVRRTLYWNPAVSTDKEGRASAVFFSNSREGQQLRFSVRGITPAGRFVDFER